MTIEFNPEIHCLGRLCGHKHDYKGTGKSVRYLKPNGKGKLLGGCIECTTANAKEQYRKKTKEQRRAYYHRSGLDARNAKRQKAYENDTEGACACGCGQPVHRGRKYISGHNPHPIGEESPSFGRVQPDKERKKRSESAKKNVVPDEQRALMGANSGRARNGRPLSVAHIEAIVDGRAWYRPTEETKAKIGATQRGEKNKFWKGGAVHHRKYSLERRILEKDGIVRPPEGSIGAQILSAVAEAQIELLNARKEVRDYG